MYHEWRSYRNSASGVENVTCDLDGKDTITVESLNFAIPRFITEVRKLNGEHYFGKTLYDIVICTQFHLETLGFCFKLLNDDTFRQIKWSLDNLMKLRTSQGVGVSVKKAQILTISDEEYLWSLGLLGRHSPEVLLNTVVFIIGKGFALRAGKEHQALRSPPFNSQMELMRDDEGYWFIRYNEEMGFRRTRVVLNTAKSNQKRLICMQ